MWCLTCRSTGPTGSRSPSAASPAPTAPKRGCTRRPPSCSTASISRARRRRRSASSTSSASRCARPAGDAVRPQHDRGGRPCHFGAADRPFLGVVRRDLRQLMIRSRRPAVVNVPVATGFALRGAVNYDRRDSYADTVGDLALRPRPREEEFVGATVGADRVQPRYQPAGRRATIAASRARPANTVRLTNFSRDRSSPKAGRAISTWGRPSAARAVTTMLEPSPSPTTRPRGTFRPN